MTTTEGKKEKLREELERLQRENMDRIASIEKAKPGMMMAGMVPFIKSRLDYLTEFLVKNWPEEKILEFAIGWEKFHGENLDNMAKLANQSVLLEGVNINAEELR